MKTPDAGQLAELERIRAAHPDGLLTAEAVVAAAEDDGSPLHPWFVWDDTAAARKYRLAQARALIRVSVTVLPAGDREFTTRAFVSLAGDRLHNGGGYRAIGAVLSAADLRADLVATALAELESLRRRYAHLSELAEVFASVDRAAAKAGRRPEAEARRLAVAAR